jgi:topoisomerase-4 subunit A
MDIIINRAHDPNQIRAKLYKLTQMEKPLSVNFKVVTDALKIDRLNMKDMILIWIDIRREYLRRLVNKKIAKLSARISLLEILIVLTSKDNLEKTIKIIKNNNEEDAIKALVSNKQIKINSYQAEKVVDSKLKAFTKDAHDKYIEELKKVKKELEYYMSMTKSSKKIDDVIESQLEDLLKYDTGRRSRIISETSNVEIPDTDHFIMISKLGMIKKLPYQPDIMVRKKTPSLGVFKNQDYPLHGISINNHDSLMLFDNFGKYSCVPVHTIESTEPSQYGSRVFDVSKLEGEVIEASPFFSTDLQSFVKDAIGSIFVVTLTKDGFLKKTPIEDFTKSRNQKNVRAMKVRDGDELVAGKIVIETMPKFPTNMLIYTEKGNFAYIRSDQIVQQSKDACGIASITLDPDDACKGICIIGSRDTNLLVVTEKGNMKLCELDYLGEPSKRKISSYLATLDVNDKIYYVDAVEDDVIVTVCTRTTYQEFESKDIPVRTRKAKCVKMVPIPVGNNIISVGVRKMPGED